MSQPSSKKPSKATSSDDSERQKLIGLGRRSVSKSYYPELKKRLDELEQFRALLDQVSDAILMIDADSGLILDVAGATKIIIGCEKDELIGIPFKRILPTHISRHINNIFHNKTPIIQIEAEIHPPSGTQVNPIPVDMTIRLTSQGDKRRAIVVARDIRERRNAEKALKKSHDQLEIRVRERTQKLNEANKAKSDFLAMVSHELRTPLTSVLGFTKVIHKKLINRIFPLVDHGDDKKVLKEMSRVTKNLDIIFAEGNRLTALINDVLDLAKLEANKMDYELHTINPADFINRSLDATEGLFKATDLILLLDIEPDLPNVTGDLDKLIQVMVNLISNAVKFTPQGTISCCAHHVENRVRISITDTGIGMPESVASLIFDKFTQIADDSSTKPQGTGLGLAICRHIIDAHNGDIWAESEPGIGSKFIFTLPVEGSK